VIIFTSHQILQIGGKGRIGVDAATDFLRGDAVLDGKGKPMDDLLRAMTHHIGAENISGIVFYQNFGEGRSLKIGAGRAP